MRYFYIDGNAHTPQRFWRVNEQTKEEYDKRYDGNNTGKGYWKAVKNDEVENYKILIQHGFKNNGGKLNEKISKIL